MVLNPIAFRVGLQAVDPTTIASRALRLEHVCRLDLPDLFDIQLSLLCSIDVLYSRVTMGFGFSIA